MPLPSRYCKGDITIPLYDYICNCSRFETVSGYDDYTITCPNCGRTANRVPVYRSQGFIVKGGPNAPMPPRGDLQAIQEEQGKELRKRDWTGERAMDELRANKFTDEQGQLRIDTTKMTKTA